MNKIPVPLLPKFSPAVAESSALGSKLAAEEASALAELRQLASPEQADEDRKARAKLIAEGKTPPPAKSQADALTRLGDLRAARDIHAKSHNTLVNEWGMKLRHSLRPAYDAEAKRFAAALVEVHSALCTMEKLKDDLNAQGLGFYTVPCSIDTNIIFKEPPFSRQSDLARLFRELVSEGYLGNMPMQLQ